ncbi:MAG: MBL fold metallo-hydrolase [Caulobacteraceae bacterium]
MLEPPSCGSVAMTPGEQGVGNMDVSPPGPLAHALTAQGRERSSRKAPKTQAGGAKWPLGLMATSILAASVAQAAEPARTSPQFITLGTGGGPIVRVKRSEPANAVTVNGSVYLFDVGDGVQRQLAAAGLPLGAVKAVFISHHHMDHNAGLGPLMMSRWLFGPSPAMPVIGPPGTRAMTAGIAAANVATVNAPVSLGRSPPPVETTVRPTDLAPVIDTPTEIYKDDNIRVLAISVAHFHLPAGMTLDPVPRSYAYRIEAAGRTFVYTGDTGPSDNLERLAKGADVLVSEVVNLDAAAASLGRTLPPAALAPLMAHMAQDHLTPKDIGGLAARAGVGEVVLTHLSPGQDDETDLTGYTRGVAPAFKGKVVLAADLDRF